MSTFSGIDKGLNFSDYAPGSERYAGKTLVYSYNEKRNETYADRARLSSPLTGQYAEYAKAEFTKFVIQNAQNGITNASVAMKFRNFLQYWLGKIDAALISNYLASGRTWKSRKLFDFQVPEMWCGQTEVTLSIVSNPDRYVEDAIKHAAVVFKNVPSVMAFINTQGDWKATKIKVSESAKTRADQIKAVEKVRDGLQKVLELPGKTLEIVPYLIGAALLFAIWSKRR